MATSRNRIIYQSQALFIGPSSTGYHIQTGVQPIQSAAQCVTDDNLGYIGTGSYDDPYNFNWTGTAARHVSGLQGAATKIHMAVNRSLIEPMERIQSANFNFTLNKTDVNEFGRVSRLDSIVL